MATVNNELLIKIKSELGGVLSDLNKLDAGIDRIDKTAKASGESLAEMSRKIAGVGRLFGGFLVVDRFVALGKEILATNVKMESLRAQLKALTGDAKVPFEFIQKFAAETPFEVEGITKAFIMLKNFGIEPTTEVMSALTNQAAELGGSEETLAGITLALGQAWSKGRLQAEEMNQLIERGVPVYDLLEKATGRNVAELQKMAERGELTRDVLQRLIAEMDKASSGANAAAMETLGGKISNLSDAWQRFEDTLLNDKSEGLIKSIVSSVTGELDVLSRYMSNAVDDRIKVVQARLDKFDDANYLGKQLLMAGGYSPANDRADLQALESQKRQESASAQAASAKKSAQQDQQRITQLLAETEDWYAEVVIADEKRTAEAREKSAQKARSKAEETAKAYQSEREAIAKNIEQLNFELSALRLSDQEREIQIKLRGLSGKATETERQQIEGLVRAIDAEVSAQRRQQAAWDQAVSDANALVDVRKRIRDFGAGEVDTSGFNSLLGQIKDMQDAGIIDTDQAKAVFDELGRAWNDGYIKPAKAGTNELSEFSIQAARNIQSSFADFLFDPFANGTASMVDNFAKALRRMMAEAASAQIFNALLGKDFGKSGELGGLLGSLGTAIMKGFNSGGSTVSVANGNSAGFTNAMNNLFVSTKHTGGIVGEPSAMRAFDAAIFNTAPRYHTGGIAGLMPNEVPTVLTKGEEVLTTDDPRHRNNLVATAGNVEVNIYNQADGTRASATQRQTSQGTQIDILVEQVENAMGQNIARGTGLAPVMEKQYGLNRAAGSF